MKKIKLKKQLLRGVCFAAIPVLVHTGVVWAAAADGKANNAWIPIDNWKLLNFSLLAFVIFLIGRKLLPPLLRSRAQGIADEIKTLEQKKADAEKTLAEYQAKFKNLDQESRQIVEDYTRQGEEAKARIIAEAKAQAEKLEASAKRNIEQEFKTAKMALQQEIVEKAIEKAEDVVKAAISSDDQDKLVDEYLKKVVA
ncbi:MAG: ATP synthase F0 subunit B [Desulfobacterales bacterium]|nr:ATP synthase F0 subunit B [Desulfobacterales bacterium]